MCVMKEAEIITVLQAPFRRDANLYFLIFIFNILFGIKNIFKINVIHIKG